MSDASRRAFLAGGVAAGSVGLAGCTGSIPGLDTDDGTGDGDEGPTLPSFHSWLYAPETVGMGAYTYTYADGAAFGDWSSERPSREIGWALRTINYGNSDPFDGVDHAVSIDYRDEQGTFGAAIVGGFEVAEMRSEIEESITAEDGVETTTYGSYDVYYDDRYAVAIGEERQPTYLMGNASSSQDATGRDVVEAMIDARGGDAARLHAVDETADRLLRRQGERTVVFGAPALQGRAESLFGSANADETPAVEAGGFTVDAGEESDDYRVTVITADPVDDTDAVTDSLAVLEWFEEPTVSRDGVVLTYEEGGTGDGGSDGDASSPEATFTIEIERDVARITHTSGEAIPVDELAVQFETDGGTQTVPFESVTTVDEVRAGHTTTVEVGRAEPGSVLRLVWTPESTVLRAERIPDGTSDQPNASFAIEFDLDRNTATVRHTGGDSIPADELDVVVQGNDPRNLDWSDLSSDRTVGQGDTVTVELTEGDYGGALLVGWRPGGEILARREIPSP